MNRITVTVEGGLLPDDLLERIADGTAPGQRAADFGVTSGRLSDEIMKAFSDAQSYWNAFRHRYERASKGGRESITTITRESFVVPLLEALGYGGSGYKLVFNKAALAVGDQSFVISHTAGEETSAPPVNIIGADDKLDERGASRRSAHSSVQEYLNVSDCVWGIASNGHRLRLLRNSSRIAKPRYIEFDLAGMMESSVYSDFHLLYRLLHRTRLPHSASDASECWLEKYYLEGIEQGSRVRDRLRDGVVDALTIFGNAFLSDEKSGDLREQIAKGDLTAAAFYRELLRLVYRMLFLMVAEERRLMFPESRENENRRAIFTEHYGVNRLRTRAEGYIGDDPEIDLWESLKEAFRILRDDRAAHMMGMAALNGELFGPHGCPHLDGGGDEDQSAFCCNDQLLRAIHALSTFDDDGVRRRVNFAALDVEELGSVYESLLEFHPEISASPPSFDLAWGSERKTTGSYYTPPDLVRELINSALIPVMKERLKPAKSKEDREQAILSMRVIDPAAGSGHFLLAAARQMGRELAKIRTGEEEPPPSAYRSAVRDVIRECIHAVDKNPLAVDLCKVALWIEGHNAGQPLSFLDHHVKCGDSLVGVFDLKVLEEGIPDDAYKAVEGDDKTAAKHYRQLNRDTKKNHPTLPQFKLPSNVVSALEALSHRDERTPDDVAAKERDYERLLNSPAMQNLENSCNAWTAGFFVPLKMPEFRGRDLVPTSSTVWERLAGRMVYGPLAGICDKTAGDCSFFHWPIRFPDVFGHGGFDVVLSNPPWEKVQVEEKQFFENRRPDISAASPTERRKLLAQLARQDSSLWTEWLLVLRSCEGEVEFFKGSGRFALASHGNLNTYALFLELSIKLLSRDGRCGTIVPSGIATDDSKKQFFHHLISTRSLISLLDFENRLGLFPEIDSRTKFCLATIASDKRQTAQDADFVFFAHAIEDLRDPERRFSLSSEEIKLLNPNTRNCPTFRSRRDAELTKTIYRRIPIVEREDDPDASYRGESKQMLNITHDSKSYLTRKQLLDRGATITRAGDFVEEGGKKWLRLYEGKMTGAFDHRQASVAYRADVAYRTTSTEGSDLSQHMEPWFTVTPQLWVDEQRVNAAVPSWYRYHWFIGYKRITSSTNERTMIAAALPRAGMIDALPVVYLRAPASDHAFLLGNLNAFILDYVARSKVGGLQISHFIFKQLPAIPPNCFRADSAFGHPLDKFILPRVVELSYTAWDLKEFAQDCGYSCHPFRWDGERRFLIRCELDAAFFHLYGISRDDADYIMETFPIVKHKDEERFGEYRTKRVILEIYDEMEQAKRTGRPYQTRLDPPPGDPRAAHQMRKGDERARAAD